MTDTDIKISKELSNILSYIENELLNETNIKHITPEHFIISVIENKMCFANVILNNLLMEDTLNEVSRIIYSALNEMTNETFMPIDVIIKSSEKEMKLTGCNEINTIHVLLSILSTDCNCKNILNEYGITYEMVKNATIKISDNSKSTKKPQQIKQIKPSLIQSNQGKIKKNVQTKVIDTYSVNLNELSKVGKIEESIGNENIYKQIFNILARRSKNNVVLVGNGGVGKCFGKGTEILMFDGSVKKVEDIKVGDKLIGPDSTERKVIGLGNGFDKLYKVKQSNGKSYVVNSEHILSLSTKDGNVVNMEIEDFISMDEEKKKMLFGWKPNGVLIEGKIENYSIAKRELLKYAVSEETKLEKGGKGYVVKCSGEEMERLEMLCNVVGVNFSLCEDGIIVHTSKRFLSSSEKRPTVNMYSEIEIEKAGVGEYYGFEIDGDKLFLLSDCTVTHNTSIIKHMANLINAGEVPEIFKKKRILQFDPSNMLIGANFRGIFEERFKSFVEEMKEDKNCILFIDDIHNSLSDRIQEGNVNISALIQTVLSETSIPFICTTNFKDYKNCIETNSNLKQKFQKIVVEPKNSEETFAILKTCKEKYENFHNVSYTEKSLKLCSSLSERYITDRFLPDSAIDIMDEVGSMISLRKTEDDELKAMKMELEDIRKKKKDVSNIESPEKLFELTKSENSLMLKISVRERSLRNYYKKEDVTDNDVKELISYKTGIPVYQMDVTEKKHLNTINERIKEVVIGQEDAIDKICQSVKRGRIGLSNKNKPIVLFLFGPTGVGKTLIAKALAKEVFGSEKYLVRLDMSEYSEKSSVTKLTGSAPGYIGFENGGQLTETIKNKKYCVLLLDEIEKANQEVHNVFLQMFDEGHLTDNTGQKIDFKNVIILMTSNTGAKKMSEFGKNIGLVNKESDNSKSILNKEMKKHFSPEFLNRIDDIIYFGKLSENDMKKIILLEIKKLDSRLKEIGYNLCEEYFSETMINKMYEKIKDQSEYGARPVIRLIQDEVENKITDLILASDFDTEEVVEIPIL